jgi:hypothetical protein
MAGTAATGAAEERIVIADLDGSGGTNSPREIRMPQVD